MSMTATDHKGGNHEECPFMETYTWVDDCIVIVRSGLRLRHRPDEGREDA